MKRLAGAALAALLLHAGLLWWEPAWRPAGTAATRFAPRSLTLDLAIASTPTISPPAQTVRPKPAPTAPVRATEATPETAPEPAAPPPARPNDHQPAAGPPPGEVVMAWPLYRENPPPTYPPAARRRQQQGTVLLAVLVNQRGEPSEVIVVESSGYPLLDQAAISGVEKWRFAPGQRNGAPVAMRVQVPIRFSLQ